MSRNTASTSQLTAYGLRVFFSLFFLCLLPLALSQVANAQSAGNFAFDYSDRAALLADGWHFMARTAAGETRDTEQTSGLIVDYSQSNHPGTVRFPADQGTLWGGVNSTRNSLFRELPSDWTTIRLGIAAFAPAAPYQGACLSAYQDDDNYVILCRDNVGAQVVEWWWENDSSPSVIGSLSNSATTNVWLRLDRNPSTDALTGFVSVDGGGAWTQLLGSVVKVLSNPRLGVVVGGNTSTSSFPAADVTFVEIGTVTDPIPAALVLNPTIISFTAVAGGANPSGQALNIATNDESSVDWTASSNQAWLSVSPVAGMTPSSGTVSVNIAGLAAGTYNETITINAPEASNSPRTVAVSLTVGSPPPAPTPHIDFNYTNRAALLAGGWDFIARTSGGGTRNTEQTSGLVVNYDQATHPGTIRIPADQGTLWGGSNNTRNTLFRDLPSDWTTVRLGIAAFAPAAPYQGACLSAYQDDDNYVILCRDNVGAQTVEWWQETGGSAAVIGSLANSATANVWLRLDRDPLNNTITGFIAVDGGVSWAQLPGNVVKSLTNPRLGVVVAGNSSTTSFPTADLAFVEVGTASVPLPPTLAVNATSLNFIGTQGGANPGSQTLMIANGQTSGGTLNWTVSGNQSWLSVSPVAGAAPSTVTVSVNTAGLAQGTFSGTITLNAAGASNSPKTVAVSLTVRPPYAPHVDMNYASRAAFLSDGWWDFLARTAGGGTRNTEQTSGLVVDYNQTTHPGTIRIPADQGTLWGSSNNTRNTLFRDLPSDWTTIRLGIAAFAPTAPYQGACLSAYQDDDNYVMLCRDNVGSQIVEWWQETGGNAAEVGSLANSATSNVWLRLDRNPATNALTAFVSVDGGVSWAQLPGNVVKSLSNSRLAVVVGGNQSTSSFPTADLAFVEVGTASVPLPPALGVSASSVSFFAPEGGANPPSKSVNIVNSGTGTLNWTVSGNQSWLSVSPVAGAAPSTVTVSVNTAGLAQGTFSGTITLNAAGASNSPKTVAVSLTVRPPYAPHVDMNYASRAAFLSDGWWDFLARTAGGGTRNTEQTSGLVVDYNQTTHPGTIRIPADQGTLWGSSNNTRNTLFRDLPSDWTTIRLGIAAFAPTAPYQGACLSAYQDDDNYVMLCRDNVGSQIVEWWQETGGNAAEVGSLANSATSNVWLRLDRNPATNALTAFVSVDGGVSWAQLPGNVVKSLSNSRLAVVVGGNQSTSSFPAADLAFVDVGTVSSPLAAVLVMSTTSMNFSVGANGTNPPSQSLGITNSGGGLLNWTVNSNQTWLSVSPGSGTAPSSITVSVNTSGLAAGTYNGTITITAPGAANSPRTVAVSLLIPQPSLALSATSMSFAALVGGANPASQTLNITNAGGSTLTWSAMDNQPWLSLNPTGATAPSSVLVSVNINGLAVGAYNGTITVNASGVSNSPQTISVTLNILSLNNAGLLTAAVLVNGNNTQGYNPNPSSPGEFQRYPERYLEHLQIPYEIINVATTTPPSNLSQRHLIIAGHRGLNLSTVWRDAIVAAVSGGTGFVNLDWGSQIGTLSHIQSIFGATGSVVGSPATNIVVPVSVIPGGSNPHYIAGFQRPSLNTSPGDLVYSFHEDSNGILQPIAVTILVNASGTVIAQADSDPFILAASYGSGRAVHFGTLEYLKADRFGFLQGVDDLFWRSLVWAAKKPFVLRGYPRLWAVQMDDTQEGWASRVRDLYDPTVTGSVNSDGTGGPWKVTGYVYTLQSLPAGSADRATAIADINADHLHVSPHATSTIPDGDIYWNGSVGQLTDPQWLNVLANLSSWRQGQGGADVIPQFSASVVPHFWNLSNNTGYDLRNSLGFRYVTSLQRAGYQIRVSDPVDINGFLERPSARPFWLYEKPPKKTRDETEPLFFADDFQVGSRTGLPAQTLFLFATQVQPSGAARPDLTFPSNDNSWTVAESIDQFQSHTWRFWSSMAPIQIFTHDASNYRLSTIAERRAMISQLSSWLASQGVIHMFMEDVGDYIYARTKSILTEALLSSGNITLNFAGNSANSDGEPVGTTLFMYLGDDEGTQRAIPGFLGGTGVTIPVFGP